MSDDELAGHRPDMSPTRTEDAQVAEELEAILPAELNPKIEVDETKQRRDAADVDQRDKEAVASGAPAGEPQTDDQFEALIAAAFGPPGEDAAVPVEGRATKSTSLDDAQLTADQFRRASFKDVTYAAFDVEVAEAQTRIISADYAPPMPRDNDPGLWLAGQSSKTINEFEAAFAEAFPEVHLIPGNWRQAKDVFPPLLVTSGLRATLEASRNAQTTTEEPCAIKRRSIGRRKRVVRAFRSTVENDSRSAVAAERLVGLHRLLDEAIANQDVDKIDAARDAFLLGVEAREDFHLSHLTSIADRIERCGSYEAFACGSYWCQNCKNRYGARLLEDTQAQLTQRYGGDAEGWRGHLLHATILNDIVIPDPDVDRDQLATFFASTIRRDAHEILGHLGRLQEDRLNALSVRLAKRGLTIELIKDWMTVGDQDRTVYDPKNAIADAKRLLELNDVTALSRSRFKPRRKRPDLESARLISWRDEERVEAYMWQLRKAQPLDRYDILAITHDLQFVDREFRGITKTNYPERLKFKSSIEKVIKRERKKLDRLNKDLPGVSLIGVFELELINLRHAINGDHQHSIKAQTVRSLASQERKPTKYRKFDDPVSFETQRRRSKTEFKNRLLDEARERIAMNRDLPESEFHGLQYAVLLHMHVVIDLNGTSRDDVARWLTGKAVGTRRFTGQWQLPYQVMIKSLFVDKPVADSLRHISFYPIKGPLTFNYENTAPKEDEKLPDGDPRHFNDEALALIAWLQHGVGHEGLRIERNWPGVDRQKRGRKPSRAVTPKITDDELEEALAELGVELPRDLIGQTNIGPLFKAAEEGAQVNGPAGASTPIGSGANDTLVVQGATDWTRSDRGGEGGS